jgi:hypothetical protein
MQTKTITVNKTCMLCGKPSSVEVPEEGYNRWVAGEFAQDAFPELSANDRETLISGSHGLCFDLYFDDGSDDEDVISMDDIQDYDID